MDVIKNILREYVDMIAFPDIRFLDFVEILFLAFIIYHLIIWVRNTRAWMLFKGIMVLVVVSMVAAVLQLNVIIWIFSKTINVGIIALIVVFQPELRRALEQLGQKNIMASLSFFEEQNEKNERFSDETVENIVSATFDLAKEKTGALIVMEREVKLGEFERTGIALDSLISSQLLINIFEHNTPLHDGAVLIRENRIVSATCYLPLSDNTKLSKELGTRHRAGIGVSEVTDSFTIIVSEETGKVSYAEGGKIKRGVNEDALRKKLKDVQRKNIEISKKVKRIKKWKGWQKSENKDNE